jgi:glycosyltransferase involved in cell wall biosynthesis
VDNCSSDASVSVIVANNGFRYVREHRLGLNWARNRGIHEANYDIIAYIDDDTLAAPGWLHGVALGFQNPQVMAVTGSILPAEIETRGQNDFELYGGMNKGFFSFEVRREELSDRELFWSSNWGAGANMAFRRALFQNIGNFDVALDVGTPTNGGGDLEFFYRAVSAGHVLRYEPMAMVRHVHRRDRLSLKKQIYNNGRSFVCYLLAVASNEPKKRLQVLLFILCSWAWPWLIRRLIASIVRHDRKTFRFVVIELWGNCSGMWAYRRSRKQALSHR